MRIPTLLRRPKSRRGMLHAAVIGGLITLLAASGAGISFALWNSQATVSGSATAASLSLSTENFSSANFTFRNNATSVLSSVTVKNTTDTTSSTKADVRIALDNASDTEGVADDIRVRVWRLTGANCSVDPTTTVYPGTWAAFTSFTDIKLIAKGESVTYCIRSAAVDDERSRLAVTDGSATVQPRITATLLVHNFTASATATAQQQTNAIYPTTNQPSGTSFVQIRSIAPNRGCVDVNGGLNPAGTNLIDFACKTGTDSSTHNQDWRIGTTSSDPSYKSIIARYNTGLRVTGTGDNARVEVQTGASTPGEWQFQQRGTSGANPIYQIVNRDTGLCLQSTTQGSALSVAQCNADSTQQGYTLFQRAAVTWNIAPLACANTSGASGVTLNWAEPALGTYTVWAQKGNTLTQIGSVSEGETSYIIPGADASWTTNATRNVELRFNSQTVSTTVWKGVTSGEHRIRCAAPTANVNGLACTNLNNGVTLTWSEPALGAYQFQMHSGSGSTWPRIGTTAAGQTSLTITGEPEGIAAGERALRVLNGGATLTSAMSLWKGQLVTGGPSILQCVTPPAVFALDCDDLGNSIDITFGHPAYSAYTVTRPGSTSTVATAMVGGPSVTVSASSAWSDGPHTLTVNGPNGATSTIQVTKGSYWEYVWVIPVRQVHTLDCPSAGQNLVAPPAATPAPSPAPEGAPSTPTPANPTKTAELSGADGYYLGLLWDAQTVGATTSYSVLVDGQPLAVTPVNEYAKDRLHLYPADFAAVAPGEKVLQVFDGGTLVISQPLLITTNANDLSNRLVFRR